MGSRGSLTMATLPRSTEPGNDTRSEKNHQGSPSDIHTDPPPGGREVLRSHSSAGSVQHGLGPDPALPVDPQLPVQMEHDESTGSLTSSDQSLLHGILDPGHHLVEHFVERGR